MERNGIPSQIARFRIPVSQIWFMSQEGFAVPVRSGSLRNVVIIIEVACQQGKYLAGIILSYQLVWLD